MVSMGWAHNRNESQGMDMKKLLTFAALGVALATAGCSKTENAGGTVKREAGNWKTDVKLVKFDVPGMLDSIRAHRTEPLSGLLDALVRDVKNFTGTAVFEDDVCLLAVGHVDS